MEKDYNLYLVLTKTDTVFARLIRLYTNNQYSHASLSLDKPLKEMYSFGRKYTKNPFIGAFVKEDLNTGIFGISNNIPSLIYKITITKEQYEKVIEIINEFNHNKEIYKYNRKGIIYNILKKPLRVDNKYFCSEFVYHVFKESGIIDLDIPYNFIKPNDLLAVKGNIIYEGNLHEYHAS